MAATYEFYHERAEAAAAAAARATLVNVRERELRAEATWRGLAEQARKSMVEREKADAARMAKREAEALAASDTAAS